MDANTELEDACNTVLNKIVRNLLSFQTAELILKEILKLGGLALESEANWGKVSRVQVQG